MESNFQKHITPRTPKAKSSHSEAKGQSPMSRNLGHKRTCTQTSPKIIHFQGQGVTMAQNPYSSRSLPPKVSSGHDSSYSSSYSSDSDYFEATTPPHNPFLSENIYRKSKHGVSPRGISRETTPDLLSEEESFFKHSPRYHRKNGLYAGPTFSNAPTPDTLPVPAFVERLPSPRNNVYNLLNSTHSHTELGLNLPHQFSLNEPYIRPFVSENDLRLRSQELLSLLNGRNIDSSSSYPRVCPSKGQQYQSHNFSLYRELPSDSVYVPV